MSKTSKLFNIIVAFTKTKVKNKGGIGFKNNLPWTYSKDLKHFKKLTTYTEFPNKQNCVIMGRNTWQSMNHKPLKNRINVVVTSKNFQCNETHFVKSINEGLQFANDNKNIDKIWVIGGSKIYNQCFHHHKLDKIYLTKISPKDENFKCDTFINLPELITLDKQIIKDEMIHKNLNSIDDSTECLLCDVEFSVNKKKDNCEKQYLSLLEKIMKEGIEKKSRNGITKSVINQQLKFDLENGFPLLTTKKMYWKGIAEELLFFLRGDTDTTKLEKQGIKIWKGNTNRDFLDKMNFINYPDGQMGPMYGYQWRSFNKLFLPNIQDMEIMEINSDNSGIDQLSELINQIKKNPTSRRLLMTNYNPLQVKEGVLYPCHSLILQFLVYENKLHVNMYQRSADVFLGLPFNIASTSLLLCIISKLTNYQPGTVTLNVGDCHIYKEHFDAVNKQLDRFGFKLPSLDFPDFNTISEVENSCYKDYNLIDYICHSPIKANMIA